jgi:hypothetical protein
MNPMGLNFVVPQVLSLPAASHLPAAKEQKTAVVLILISWTSGAMCRLGQIDEQFFALGGKPSG